jgi:uridine phosphorylase
MTEWPRGSYNLLALDRDIEGPVVTYVRSDFRDGDLLNLCSKSRLLNKSYEYSVYSATYDGKEIVFLSTGSAAANVITALYEISHMNIGPLVRIGATGGRNTEVNQVVLAEAALCKDQVSSILVRGRQKVRPSERLTDRIDESLQRNKIQFAKAVIGSVEAMYFFERELRRAEREGAYCWDLETASVLAFGRRYRIDAASVLLSVSGKNGTSVESYPPIQRFDFVSSVLEALAH